MNNKFLINSYSLLEAHITSPLAELKELRAQNWKSSNLGIYNAYLITNNFVTNKNSKRESQKIKISLNLRNYQSI